MELFHCQTQPQMIILINDFGFLQSLGKKDLIPIMTEAKVTFKYIPAEDPSEHTYGSLQNDALERYFLMFR